MAFNDIVGQVGAKRILKNALKENRLAHAYLFYGPEGVGKEFSARTLAKVVNCERDLFDSCDLCLSCRKIDQFNHPDVRLLFPLPSSFSPEEMTRMMKEKREKPHLKLRFAKATSISIDEIRQLQRDLAYKTFEGKKRVIIILDADKMTLPAANAFLKTLEEPPANNLLILTTERPHFLLPTIVSRCQPVRFGLLREKEIEEILTRRFGIEPTKSRLLSRLSEGSLGKAIEIGEGDFLLDRESVLSLLKSAAVQDRLPLFKMGETLAIQKNRGFLERMMEILSSWYKDLLAYKAGNKRGILNLDLEEELREQAEGISLEGVLKSLQIIEKLKRDLVYNPSLELALVVLLLRLEKIRQGEAQVA